jgi:hypothetical protein
LRRFARAAVPLALNSHFALTLRGENLADQHYETTIGFPALGTTLFCGAENPVLKLIVVKSIDSRVRMDHRGVGTPLS